MKKFIFLYFFIFYGYVFSVGCRKSKNNILSYSNEEVGFVDFSYFNNLEYLEKINSFIEFFNEEMQYKIFLWRSDSSAFNNEVVQKNKDSNKNRREKKKRHLKDEENS
jgi:hypothetical protein